MAIKNLDELAKFVKGGADVLQKALTTDEEVHVELMDGSFVSDEQLETLKNDVIESRKPILQGVGYDFAMKDIKKDFEIEIEGKDRKKIVEAIKNKIISDAKIEPDKKVNELNQSLENLRKQYAIDLEAKDSELNKYKNHLTEIRTNEDLLKHVPEGLNGIDKEDFITLAKTKAAFTYDEGKLVVKQGDTILKDKYEKPIEPKDFLTQLASQKNWIKTDGRGGGDDKGNGGNQFKSLSDVYRYMEQNGISPTSLDGRKMIDDFTTKKY